MVEATTAGEDAPDGLAKTLVVYISAEPITMPESLEAAFGPVNAIRVTAWREELSPRRDCATPLPRLGER